MYCGEVFEDDLVWLLTKLNVKINSIGKLNFIGIFSSAQFTAVI